MHNFYLGRFDASYEKALSMNCHLDGLAYHMPIIVPDEVSDCLVLGVADAIVAGAKVVGWLRWAGGSVTSITSTLAVSATASSVRRRKWGQGLFCCKDEMCRLRL